MPVVITAINRATRLVLSVQADKFDQACNQLGASYCATDVGDSEVDEMNRAMRDWSVLELLGSKEFDLIVTHTV